MISQLSSCGPSFPAIPTGKMPSKSPAKVWGEHSKIKKLTFLINGIEVAGVMAVQPLLQLFQPLLLQTTSPMVSCGKGRSTLLGAWGPHQADPSEGCRALPCAGGCGVCRSRLCSGFQGVYMGGAALHLSSGNGLEGSLEAPGRAVDGAGTASAQDGARSSPALWGRSNGAH